MNAYTDLGVQLLKLARDYADMLASLLPVAPSGTNEPIELVRECACC